MFRPLNRQFPSARRTLTLGIMLASTTISFPTFSQDASDVEEIIVTGSYIRSSATDAPSPVQVIDRESIGAQGAANVWDVIKNLEINSGSTTGIGGPNEGGGIEGTANINLRNLGQNATLTLINGKRQVSAATTTRGGGEFVDINSIPTTMMQRIEILTDGGSALYGSDAVAGVVNIIMRTDFVGTELYGDVQQIQGAGSKYDSTVSGIYGWESADTATNFVISGEYFERDLVPVSEGSFFDDRSEFLNSVTGVYGNFTPFAQGFLGANFNPAYVNVELTAQNNANRASRGLGPQIRYTDPLCGDPSLGFDTRVRNREELFTSLSPTCETDVSAFQSILNKEQRQSITASLGHQINDNAEFYSLFQYSQNKINRTDRGSTQSLGPSTQLAAPGSYSNAFGATLELGAFAPFIGNPSPVITNAPNSLANGGPNVASIVNGPTDLPFIGGDDQTTESLTWGVQLGIKGDFTFIDRKLNYDVSYAFSQNSFEQRVRTVQRDRIELAYNGLGGPNCTPNGIDNFDTTLGALGPFGGAIFQEFFPGYHLNTRETISLAVTSSNQGQGGCEFFNPYLTRLTDPSLANSQELIEWMTPTQNHVDGRNKLGVFDAVVSGELFDMDSGPLQFALGYQFRGQQNRSTAGPLLDLSRTTAVLGDDGTLDGSTTYSSNNLICSFCIATYDNRRNIRAVFGELSIPFADSIESQIAVRYEDYGGGIGSEISPKFAMSWRPNDALIFRGSFSQSFRAPNVSIVQQGYRASSNRTQDILSDQDVRAGILAPTAANAEPEQVFTLGRASEALGNESADTFNIGFQWTPIEGLLEGLNLQADFWRFELEDAVVPQPITDALAGELALFNTAAANSANYVENDTLEPGETLTSCDPNNLRAGLDRGNCVVNPAAYQIVGVQRALNSDGDLVTAIIGAVNAGEIISDGVDLKIDYGWSNDSGNFRLGLDFTHVNQYQLNGIPGLELGLQGTGVTDAAGTTGDGVVVRSLPDNKGNISFNWSRDRHSANAIMRYIGSYDDLLAASIRETANPEVAAAVTDTIDSYTTLDVQYNYTADLWGSTTGIFTFGVLDLFEEDVPYRETSGGFNYDTVVFDGRGRRIYARALIQF
ncbi:MAG: hypothetical protein COC19_01740 [SAR86 cluster bacterium]|uniref:TonB-dependent receptor n=1 Tax=SAR86 cluster bacterium TaxID=2030880 RepID=A0A2A4MSN9_9GAMM|nr:MAG: hypothetical protein COC19_01740 [SAR86 cluster bacterium]